MLLPQRCLSSHEPVSPALLLFLTLLFLEASLASFLSRCLRRFLSFLMASDAAFWDFCRHCLAAPPPCSTPRAMASSMSMCCWGQAPFSSLGELWTDSVHLVGLWLLTVFDGASGA